MGHKYRKKTQAEIDREELTKTQVLNLKELEQVANYEKKVSLKPVISIACFGIVAIALGVFYPSMTSMLSKNTANTKIEDNRASKQEKRQISTSAVQNLSCSLTQPNVTEGTVATTTFSFEFSNHIIASYKKTIDIKAEGQLTATPLSIVALDTSLTNLMQTPLTGYQLEKKASASTIPTVVDGYQAVLTVDFSVFNKATLTALHTSNYFANVEFDATDTKDIAQQKAVLGGYICK